MKKLTLSLTVIGLIVSLPLAPTVFADVHQTIDKTYNLETAPIDVTGSADGKYTFILAEGGKVYIYSDSGEQNELIVDPQMDKISTNGIGDKIFLSSKKSKRVQQIFVDFTQDINIDGSPFLGSENALVTIITFSDFQ